MIQNAVGGTQKRFHLMKMQREGCHVLVGTPGRLKDILSDPSARVSAPRLSALVLDEADRLLEQVLWPDIQDIQGLRPDLSKQERQTMMFSANVPQEVVSLVRRPMKPNIHFVRTVQENETHTHERV